MSESKHHGEHHSKHEVGHESPGSSLSNSTITFVSYAFIAGIVIMIIFNQLQINTVSSAFVAPLAGGTGASLGQATQPSGISNTAKAASAGTLQFSDIVPTGTPLVYGQELGVSYDDISASNPQKANDTIRRLSVFDNGISLSGEKLQRYIDITTNISCEYCCGAEAITFKNGKAACGCAHSAAMRGLAKYLLDKHSSEFTNDQILGELGKLKVLFFPGNMLTKAEALKAKNIELNYINLSSNNYKGIEKGVSPAASSAGGQVGGC